MPFKWWAAIQLRTFCISWSVVLLWDRKLKDSQGNDRMCHSLEMTFSKTPKKEFFEFCSSAHHSFSYLRWKDGVMILVLLRHHTPFLQSQFMNLTHYKQLILLSFVREMLGALDELLRGYAGSPFVGMEGEDCRTECALVSRALCHPAGFADELIGELYSQSCFCPSMHSSIFI